MTLNARAIVIECEDSQGRPQRRTFTEPRLERMWLLLRTSSHHFAEVETGRWAPSLHALGLRLQEQAVAPHRIWSNGESIQVATPGRSGVLCYAEERLHTHDRRLEVQEQAK
jgi:hypothetical protein